MLQASSGLFLFHFHVLFEQFVNLSHINKPLASMQVPSLENIRFSSLLALGETSPVAISEEKRMFSQASRYLPTRQTVKLSIWACILLVFDHFVKYKS